MDNRFYVRQGPGIAPGLVGLAGAIEQRRQRKIDETKRQREKEEFDRQKLLRSKLLAIQQRGKPTTNEVAQLALEFPEWSSQLKVTAGMFETASDAERKKQETEYYRSANVFLADPNKFNLQTLLKEQSDVGIKVSPDQIAKFEKDPKAYVDRLRNKIAAMFPDETLKQAQAAKAKGIKKEYPDWMTEEQKQQAQLYEMGLASRPPAETPEEAAERAKGVQEAKEQVKQQYEKDPDKVPEWFTPEQKKQAKLYEHGVVKRPGETPEEAAAKARAVKQAELEVRYDLEPKIAKEVIEAEEKGLGRKKLNEKLAEQFAKDIEFARKSLEMDQQLDRMSLALSRGAKTGKMEEFILEGKSFLQSIGFDVGDLSEQEMLRELSNKMALMLRNPSSGLGLTGNTSERDLQFLKDSVPGLARTEGGNVAIIGMLKKVNGYKQALAQEQLRLTKKGFSPIEVSEQMISFARGYEIFSKQERKQIERLLRQDPQKQTPDEGKIEIIEWIE